jgi:hypothetical protein
MKKESVKGKKDGLSIGGVWVRFGFEKMGGS